LRRLQVADLNFDGAITRDEMAVLVAAAAAKSRGRLWALFERADGSGDAVVKADEMLAYGRTEAMTSFSVADEALVRSVLTFDANADGLVALDEVRAAVAALGT
jgi:Ca2+-binding EF-hand superfamily protein